MVIPECDVDEAALALAEAEGVVELDASSPPTTAPIPTPGISISVIVIGARSDGRLRRSIMEMNEAPTPWDGIAVRLGALLGLGGAAVGAGNL